MGEEEQPGASHVLQAKKSNNHLSILSHNYYDGIACDYESPVQSNNLLWKQDFSTTCSQAITVEGSGSYQPIIKATLDDVSTYARPGDGKLVSLVACIATFVQGLNICLCT